MTKTSKFKSTLCGCFAPRAAEADTRSSSIDDQEPKGDKPQRPTLNVDEVVQITQMHPASEAHRSGRLAITFSGGGFLLPYFIGVADTLLQLGVLRCGPDCATPVAGASAGSLIAVSLACGLSPARILHSFMDSVQDCRTNGSYRRLEEVLYRQLESTLPRDAAERCAGRVTVAVTQLFPRPRTHRISSFTSREDLIRSLMASCHIPTYFNGDLTTKYRGKRTVDGGMTALMPAPTAPHDFLLKVCCFTRPHVARLPIFNRRRALHQLALGITPDAFEPWPYSYRQMLAAALHPRSFRFIRKLLEAGAKDAARWACAAGLAGQDRLERLVPLQLPTALTAAAAPREGQQPSPQDDQQQQQQEVRQQDERQQEVRWQEVRRQQLGSLAPAVVAAATEPPSKRQPTAAAREACGGLPLPTLLPTDAVSSTGSRGTGVDDDDDDDDDGELAAAGGPSASSATESAVAEEDGVLAAGAPVAAVVQVVVGGLAAEAAASAGIVVPMGAADRCHPAPAPDTGKPPQAGPSALAGGAAIRASPPPGATAAAAALG